MTDRIEAFGDSLIQHGSSNDRAYLMKIDQQDCPAVVGHAVSLAKANGYSKIFAKSPQSSSQAFLNKGFVTEATVPGLFNGRQDGSFLSKFLNPERRLEQKPETVRNVLDAARIKAEEGLPKQETADDYQWRVMTESNVEAMARLYKRVFETYPFPIHEPAYLARTMNEDVVYHGIWHDGELVALSSAEIDIAGQNAEMTDFATRPDYRGRGLATRLLEKMEDDVGRRGIRTAYTIARAYSYGMNITFARHGYEYAGTLTNNTQISGQLESMNVWYKPL